MAISVCLYRGSYINLGLHKTGKRGDDSLSM